MELAHRWHDRNLARMELVIAVLILGLLVGVFSRYTLRVFAHAERSMMNSTVISINTALNYRASMAVMMGKYDELEFLLKMNPMEDMQTIPEVNHFNNEINNYVFELASDIISPPSNYGGNLASYDPDLMEKGKWYYQQDEGLIVYTISNSEFFESNIDGLARIRFRIKFDYKDNNANGQYDKGVDEFNFVKLQAIDSYTWDL